jgi:putative glutamine amidotransferase
VDGTTLHTNSYHNFCITAETLAPALRAFAICPDGTIEGAYHPALPIAGIMWHPERAQPDGMTARYNTDLITAFLGRESFWRR